MNNNQDDGSAKDGDGDTKKIQGGKKERKIKKKKPKKVQERQFAKETRRYILEAQTRSIPLD
jgi:hypothetical protein